MTTTTLRTAADCARLTSETIGKRAVTAGGAEAGDGGGDDGGGGGVAAAVVVTDGGDGAMTIADDAETRTTMTRRRLTDSRRWRATATIRGAAAVTDGVAVAADGTSTRTRKMLGAHAALVRVGWAADPLAGARLEQDAVRSPVPVAALLRTPFSAGWCARLSKPFSRLM